MRPFRPAAVLSLLLVAAGCAPAAPPEEMDASTQSVWTIDLVRTLPGRQDAYLQNITQNWSGARSIARDRGAVRSYRAFAAQPDSARGWDIVLMTEYADSSAWADREAIFQEIFASPDYVHVPMPLPSDEVRAFAAGGVVLEEITPEHR